MNRIGEGEAGRQLSVLLDRVGDGETIIITRRGKAVARLVPVIGPANSMAANAAAALREFRKSHALGSGLSVADLIREGRAQ